MPRIEILQGDITRLEVDAIVNAANRWLRGGGGVDGAIHRAAGPGLLEECMRLPADAKGTRCPTGQARVTAGHDLPARWVIHTVGPVWNGGKQREDEVLASCYRASLTAAAELGARSIAFPAISTGVYGFPLACACRIAARTVTAWAEENPAPERIVLVAFDAEARETLEGALRRAQAR